MLFHQLIFAVFLPIVFGVYWFVLARSVRLQNVFLILASYVFYGWWDYRFVALIVISSATDYFVGLGMGRTENRAGRRLLLIISLGVNLGVLGFFKYFNFFADSLVQSLAYFGLQASPLTLNVVLPVGISFYTFQTLSYTIDVYRRRIETCRDPLAFFAYVSFFPQLVAGPIERAENLLPQFRETRRFRYATARDGSLQILWGLFKKVVIADTCAEPVNWIFTNYETLPGPVLLLGVFLFAFQIYGDFSGYSDIAIGTAKLFGIRLMINFRVPYFSRDIAEFWRRWHISLSTWFRDYVYIPLGGSRVARSYAIRNVLIVFVLSGLWHGANWTFVIWGALNAIYFLPLMLRKKNRAHLGTVAPGKWLPSPKDLLRIGMTFALTLLAWVFFRSESVQDALHYLARMFQLGGSDWSLPFAYLVPLPLIAFMVAVEWCQRDKDHPLQMGRRNRARWLLYSIVFVLIVMFWTGGENAFIYFQF